MSSRRAAVRGRRTRLVIDWQRRRTAFCPNFRSVPHATLSALGETPEINIPPEFVLRLPDRPHGDADAVEKVVVASADDLRRRTVQGQLPRDSHGALREIRGQYRLAQRELLKDVSLGALAR